MLQYIRQTLTAQLWQDYCSRIPLILKVENALDKKNIRRLPQDHFALIDLPGPHTGIPYLSEIFQLLGYTLRGSGYLPNKQNDFAWFAESDSDDRSVFAVLPQVVVADFRLDELPSPIKQIITKYAAQAQELPREALSKLGHEATINKNKNAADQLLYILRHYLAGRDWPMPSVREFRTVQEFNELLAWVLIFGRRPNHFTLSIHLMPAFGDLVNFNAFMENELHIQLNCEGGVIKGGQAVGMAQSSTAPCLRTVSLSDGEIELPTEFLEFVWRYPREASTTRQQNTRWGDFYTGFIAQQANHVIESLATTRASPEYHHIHRAQSDDL